MKTDKVPLKRVWSASGDRNWVTDKKRWKNVCVGSEKAVEGTEVKRVGPTADQQLFPRGGCRSSA